ncbi:hypothetical protein [Phreatobacter oligotrophus]|jgi:hypothetical protein|uniref:hypothetical protein n=1 Tax=Phreatobacter oligotrophus TaxID=1122261 RepID=UPI002357970E|nr:hypothetical protein [Phreatobacter oligotrophus]MBX9990099.1 hypothetical protein [Phreatobacter oligotrophus]
MNPVVVRSPLPLATLILLSCIAAGPAAAQTQQVTPVQQAPDRVAPPPVGPTPTDISAETRRAQEAASAGRSVEALDALDEAAIAVSEKMPLTIRRATFVAEEPQGYGVFNPRDSTSFEASQPLLVYAELAGQGWRRSGDIFRTDIVLDFELRRADGQSLVAQQAFNTIATASRRRNREFFLYVTYSFSGLEPGDYVVRTTVRDRVGAKQTAFDLAFAVRR